MNKTNINWINFFTIISIIFFSLLLFGCPSDNENPDDDPILLRLEINSDNNLNLTVVRITLKKNDTNITDADVSVNDTAIAWDGVYYSDTLSLISSETVTISITGEDNLNISESFEMPGPPTNIHNSGTDSSDDIKISWYTPDPVPDYNIIVYIDSESHKEYKEKLVSDTEHTINAGTLSEGQEIKISVTSQSMPDLSNGTYTDDSYVTLLNSDSLIFTTK